MMHGITKRLPGYLACLLVLMAALSILPGTAFANEIQSSVEDGRAAATMQDAAFGIADFERLQTGSNKSEGDQYLGYVYALGKGEEHATDVTVLPCTDQVLIYVDPATAAAAGFDPESEADCSKLQAMLESLDDRLANGGHKLSALGLPYRFTTENPYVEGSNTFRFAFELNGYYYSSVTVEGAESSRGVTQFCDHFQLLPASQVSVTTEKGWLESTAAFLTKLDWRPLWVSLKTSFVALVIIFILGLLAAWRCMHVHSRWKSILDSVFTIPMVLPPTVCGFILLLIFGKSTAFGSWLIEHGIALVFTWPAAVIAAVVVGFPLMYRTVLGAFEGLDTNMLDAARTLGWSEGKILYRLMVPLAWPSIAAGTVLAFARALGEFGATLFFAGNYAGVTQTIPIAIYFNWMGGNTETAYFWSGIVIAFSFLVILFINLWSRRTTKYNRKEVGDE
jgi:molybdate transport system permease protein